MPYELMEEEPESGILSYGKEALRHGARTASDITTQVIGFPGDVFSLINEYIAKPTTEFITGKEGLPYEKTLLGKVLPTTETHRKGLQEATGEFLKPQNEVEKFVTNVVDDATLLLSPTKIASKGIKLGTNIFKSLAKSIGANLAGESAKEISGSEGAGVATKAGSLFMLSLLDQKSAAKHVADLYKIADENLTSNAKTGAIKLDKQLNSLERSLTKDRPRGNLSAPEKFVVDQVDKVKNLIKDGEISVEKAIAQKRSLNKELATLYKEVPGKKEQRSVKDLAKQINGYLNSAIEDYGKKNPRFYGPYKKANEAFGTLASSNWVSSWIENNIVQHPVTTGLMHVLMPVGTATATATSLMAPYQAAKISYRIAKSPTLAKIYAKIVNSAVKEDSKVFNKYLKQLDEKLQEEENEDRYEFID